jgi:hypothetical protein
MAKSVQRGKKRDQFFEVEGFCRLFFHAHSIRSVSRMAHACAKYCARLAR